MADSYATEANAGYRITGTKFNSTANALGHVRASVEKLVDREVLMADGNNTPTARPVNTLDCRCTIESLDQAGALSESTAAANVELDYTEANGNSASIIVGAMLPGSVRHNWGRNMGGFGWAQDFELQGGLTYTPSS